MTTPFIEMNAPILGKDGKPDPNAVFAFYAQQKDKKKEGEQAERDIDAWALWLLFERAATDAANDEPSLELGEDEPELAAS